MYRLFHALCCALVIKLLRLHHVAKGRISNNAAPHTLQQEEAGLYTQQKARPYAERAV